MTDRTVAVRLKAFVDDYIRDFKRAGRETAGSFGPARAEVDLLQGGVDGLSESFVNVGDNAHDASDEVRLLSDRVQATGSERNTRQIDRLSGRLRILAESLIALGPAAGPVAVSVVPALAGLSSIMILLGGTVVTGALALQGVGKALKAISAAKLDPTAENLEKVRETMAAIGPDGREFVNVIQDAIPVLRELQDTTRAGVLPGLGEGLDDALTKAPIIERLLAELSGTSGEIARRAGSAIADGELDDFIQFLSNEAEPQLLSFARTIAGFGEGTANTLMALDPLIDQFSNGMLDLAQRFAESTRDLDNNESFESFVAFTAEQGPEALDTLLALADAFIDISVAAAPLSGPVLDTLQVIAETVSLIAESPIGPPLIAMAVGLSALNRGVAVTAALGKGIKTLAVAAPQAGAKITALAGSVRLYSREVDAAGVKTTKLAVSAKSLGKGAAVAAGIGVAASGAADSIGATNTASLALAGTIAGPWGAAFGAGIGLLMDFSAAEQASKESALEFAGSLDQVTGALTKGTDEIIYQKLRAEGLLDTFGDIGVSPEQLINAVREGGDAIDELNAKVEESGGILVDFGGGSKVDITAGAINGVEKLNEELRDGVTETKRHADALDLSGQALDGYSSHAIAAAEANERFADSVGKVNRQLDKRSKLRDYQKAVDELAASIKENGNSFDINTEKGRANQAALDDVTRRAIEVAETLKGADRIDFLRSVRADIEKTKDRLSEGKDSAEEFERALRRINGMIVQAKIRLNVEGPRKFGEQDASFFAFGGIEDHQPQIASANRVRVWAEPETGGEAYIPLRNDVRRPRAKRIAEQAVGIMGGRVEWYARGGITVAPSVVLGGRRGAAGLTRDDLQAVATLVAAARPLVGTQNVNPHDYSEFVRHQQRTMAALASGGRPVGIG